MTRKTYMVETDSFIDAIEELAATYIRENPDGSAKYQADRWTFTVKAPKKVRK